MPSTFDPLLRLELQAVGENSNTWGVKNNTNYELVAASIAGHASISAAGSGTLTLTTANAATDQARQAFLTFTGLLTGNRTIIIPSSSKIYYIRNNTTGSFTLTVKTTPGVGVEVPQGTISAIACDGTDCFDTESDKVSKTGDVMTGTLALPSGTSVSASQAMRSDEITTRVSTIAGPMITAGISVLSGQVSVLTSAIVSINLVTTSINAAVSVRAPIATSVAGVGKFQSLSPAIGAAAVLPAGGTWAYALTLYNTGVAANFVADVGAGGSTVGAATPGQNWIGFCWRQTL